MAGTPEVLTDSQDVLEDETPVEAIGGEASRIDTVTFNQRLLDAFDLFGGETCFRVWRNGRFRDVSYRHFRRQTLRLAVDLHARGAAGERLALWADTSPEWLIGFFAAQLSGATAVPMRRSAPPATVRHVLRDSGARFVLAQSADEAAQIESWSGDFDALDAGEAFDVIVVEDGGPVTSLADITSRRLASGQADALRRFARAVPADAPALIWYAKSQFGKPLGAEFTQAQRAHSIECVRHWLTAVDDDVAFTAMPWDESASLDLALAWFVDGVPNVLCASRGLQIEQVQQASPTITLITPHALQRAWDEVVDASLQRLPESTQEMFRWALTTGKQLHAAGDSASRELRERYARADRTFFSRIRGALGGRFRRIYCGGAPLPRQLAETVEAIGIAVINTYHVAEAGGFPAVNAAAARRADAVGPAAPGFEIQLGELGEVQVRGDSVMRGYHGADEATAGVLDADGWLQSGDFGRLDDDGHLLLTGRGGDTMLLATGRRVAPAHVESLFEASPLIDQVAVFGDGRPYVTALLVPDLEALAERFRDEVDSAGPADDATDGAALGEDDAAVDAGARGGDSGPVRAVEGLHLDAETPTERSIPWYWSSTEHDEMVVTHAHPRVEALLAAVVDKVNARLDEREQVGAYCLVGQRWSAEAERLGALREQGRSALAREMAEPLQRLYPQEREASEGEITRIEVGPERLRELLEKEAILDAWSSDANIAFLFDLARDHQIDTPSVVHICDTVASVAQMEAEEKPLSTALVVGDPVRIQRVLPASLIHLHRYEHIRRMRSRMVDLAKMVDGRVLTYVVDKHGFVRGVCRLSIDLPQVADPILGPQFRLHAHVSRLCRALVFFVPKGGRQVRVFSDGQLVGRYSHGDWQPETEERLEAAVERLTVDRPYDGALVRRLLRCAFRMSEDNLGAILIVGDADRILDKSDAPDISHYAWIASTPVAELSDQELINFAQQDGATVIDAQTGRFRGCMVLLRPDASTEADIGPGKGARHSSAAKTSAEASALCITVSQDGPITVYENGRRVLSL